MGLAGLIHQAVDEREVVASLFGLDQLPTERRDHRIQAQGTEFGPDGLHVFKARRGRVVQLAGEHEERFAVDDELGGRAALFQMRHAAFLGAECRSVEQNAREQN